MKKNILGVLLGLSSICNAQTIPSPSENYIYARTCLDASCVKKSESIQYFDGLGRLRQNIANKATPDGNDLVTVIEYDGFGRSDKDFLPMPQQGTSHGAIYETVSQTVGSALYGTGPYYVKKDLESSPLNRLEATTAPGEWSLNGKKVIYEYLTNGNNEVMKFVTTTPVPWTNGITHSTLSLVGGNYYPANQLYKNKVADEDGNISYEFKNGEGQTLLVSKIEGATRADTYYIYNAYNQLAFVLSPEASDAISNNFTIDLSETGSILTELCYQYRYDGQNRLVEKKLPGKGWEFMVYDKQDRLVLTQDAQLRLTTNNFKAKGWLFTKYDQFGRVVYTGFFPNGATRVSMQSALNNMRQNAGNNEKKTTSPSVTLQGISLYYDNQAFPTGNKTLLSVNYYDSYPSDMPAVHTFGFTQTFLSDDAQATNISTKSLATASYVKNIEDDNWTKNYSFYDDKGRAIGGYSINHLGGFTKTESFLDFVGIPQQTYTHHKRNSGDDGVKIKERFVYNPYNGALEKHYHEVVGRSSEVLLADKEYNEIGQLKTKKVGNNIQEIAYTYNIRGWMTGINVDTSGNFQLGKLFNYRIGYNDPLLTLSTKPYAADQSLEIKEKYNGNIATVTWKYNDIPNTPEKKYGYVYDRLNRLRAGFYYQNTGSGHQFTEEHNELQKYDLNGNISELKRFSYKTGTAPYKIDDLEYTYVGNRVTKITDTYGDRNGYEGGGNTISYDLNGNMTNMLDKGITNITYNYLNLPSQITQQNTTQYLYRADGVKLKKAYTLNNATGSHIINSEYLDGFQYVTQSALAREALSETDDHTLSARTAGEEEAFVAIDKLIDTPGTPDIRAMVLSFFPTAEGFYDFTENKYIYQYKDHLGNTRLSYAWNTATNSIDVLDKNDYYPFGMNHLDLDAGSFFGQGSYKNYKYNGKELQETGMYDYGARMYMPDIGRWGVVDELAEKFNRHTPYAYVVNDPINGIDPDGRDVIFLADPQAVPVAGHGAVIVGNKRDGWYYYSMNGTGEGRSPYGDSKNADVGTFLGRGLSPKQAMLKANTVNPKEQHKYSKFTTVKTTKEEDEKIKVAAAKAASAETYCVIGQSCANVMLDAFNKIVDMRTNNAWYVPHRIDPAPNSIMKNLKSTIDNYNVLFLPSNKEIETRKVGKLIVGPLIPEGVEKNDISKTR